MSEPARISTQANVSSQAWLQRIGALGTVLALAILGASVLLRLTTVFAADGQTVSTLPSALEHAARLLHRLCASSVAMLALGAVVLCWKQRKFNPELAKPTAWIAASTVILALIGPLTPGYRLGAITVLNVTVGMLLLVAFWWLRESVATQALTRPSVDRFSWAAIVAFFVHVATGAAASAWEMRGLRWPAFVHLGSLALAVILIVAILLELRGKRALTPWTSALTGLLTTQLFVGYVLMWQESRPPWLSFLHAMLSPLLALALVSLSQRRSIREVP